MNLRNSVIFIALPFFAACGGESSTSSETGAGSSTTEATSEATSEAMTDELTTDTTGPEVDERGCWVDLAVGEHEVLSEQFTGGSEGIAFGADGRLFVSSDERVWTLSATGERTEFTAIPSAIGIARRSNNGLYVASLGEIDPKIIDGGVYVVEADGTTSLLVDGIASPNFAAVTPSGDVLISDDFDTRVFLVTAEGGVSEAISDVPSPNGMAYSPDGAHLFVASTFTADGQLTKFDTDMSGLPIEDTAREIMHLGVASTPDGIAVDADGMVYVAANIPGEIWRVDGSVDTLTEGELVASGVANPASLAFGEGGGFDPCSLYVTQLDGARIHRVSVGAPAGLIYE
ncbi:MAG: SMP-30/gluconolactonase/LRE family protein [Nannocystaceae bacterium]